MITRTHYETLAKQAAGEKVDVLAVMESIGNLLIDSAQTPANVMALHEARAAVAEMIEATQQFMRRQPRFDNNRTAMARENNRLRAALARVGGAQS